MGRPPTLLIPLLFVNLLGLSACASDGAPSRSSGQDAVQQPLVQTTTAAAATSGSGRHTAPSSIAADCSRAVEGEIMEWIRGVPDGATLVFGPDACYGQDDSITLDDRQRLTIDGNGSTFKALTTGSPTRSNWRIRSGSDITLRNMIVRGSQPEAKYVKELEYQHGYAFQGTRNGVLDNVQAYEVHGDFVEAQHDSRLRDNVRKAPPAFNIVVRNSRFETAGRMGIGLTNVEGFVMENSYVGNVALSAVDVEPDVPTQKARDIRIVGNTFGSFSHAMFVSHGKGENPEVGTVLVADNVMEVAASGCVPAIFVRTPGRNFRTGYVFRNNRLVASGDGVRLDGLRDVEIVGNTIQHRPEGRRCPSAVGAFLRDSHDVTVASNVFADATTAVKKDARSTNVSERENRLQR